MTGVQRFFLLLTLWLVTLSLLPFFTDPGRWMQIAVLEGAALQHAFGGWEGEVAARVTEGLGDFFSWLLFPFRLLYGWNEQTYWYSLNGAWQVGKTTPFYAALEAILRVFAFRWGHLAATSLWLLPAGLLLLWDARSERRIRSARMKAPSPVLFAWGLAAGPLIFFLPVFGFLVPCVYPAWAYALLPMATYWGWRTAGVNFHRFL